LSHTRPENKGRWQWWQTGRTKTVTVRCGQKESQ
jgi:hypothetical protein